MLSAISVTGSIAATPGNGISPATDGVGAEDLTPGSGISPANADVASTIVSRPAARESRRHFISFSPVLRVVLQALVLIRR